MDIPEWRLPDAEVAILLIRPERAGVGVNHNGLARVTHMPTGKAVLGDEYRSGWKNAIAARLKLEAWILDGVEPDDGPEL